MKWIISIVILAVLFGFGIYLITPAGISGKTVNGIKLPKYAMSSPQIEEAYLFAKENPNALDSINCYCSCMQMEHNGRTHKRGLLDCFFKENGDFEEHASQCNMCVTDALLVKNLTLQGKTKEEIKVVIDAKYTELETMQH